MPTHFTIAVKLKNVGNVQYLDALTTWKNLKYKRALETRDTQCPPLSQALYGLLTCF